MIKKLPYEEFKSIYSRVPRLCVDLYLTNDESNVLLVKRDVDPDKGIWHFPGGTVLRGESVNVTANRIANEEIGISDLGEIDFLGIMEFDKESTPFFHVVSLVYTVRLSDCQLEEIVKSGKDFSFFSKFPEQSIPEQALFASEISNA